jgi:hypothetical protein
MKLRTAIKIVRNKEEFVCLGHKKNTIRKAYAICRRKWQDYRIPYLPDDNEMLERTGFFLSILGDVLIDDPEKRDKFKNELWMEIGKTK